MISAKSVRVPFDVAHEAPLQKVNILLVDDNLDNLFSIQTALEPLNERLLTANSGKDALRLCLDNDFAAILLDVRMPDMDGFETAEFIRTRPRSRHTPLLFLTAYRSDEQLFRGYDLGAVDFLFRPVVPEILQSKVRAFVELSRKAQLLREQAAGLARAERKFRSLLEAAPDAMAITREDGTIVLANTRTDELFGYSREELVGENIALIIPEWNCAAGGLADEEPVALHRGADVRFTAIRADRTTFPVEITSSRLSSEEGVMVTNAIRDITERVRAEHQIRRINTELERRVAERTAELTCSNEALRQFAWAASHDLQEPLRMLISFSQLLAQSCGGKLSAEEGQLLRMVEENATRMENLLGALRQYLQIAESQNPVLAQVDCEAVLAAALQNLSGAIHESRAAITHDPLPTVYCAEVVLLQLFQNLISNAIKYRDEDPPRIHVSAASSGPEWVFSVRDNGIGIEPQYLEYVFGVFKRLQPHRYAGTGIGLALCKAAVERIGGRIWAESEGRGGTTFKFAVPAEAR